MPNRKAAQPELFSVDSADSAELSAGKCRACGYLFFPPQRYGCESCGAPPEQLESVKLAGRGRLHSYATVHLHQDKDIKPPFTVGVITLADGVAVRSVLTTPTDAGLAIGDQMKSVMVEVGPDEEGNQLVELRFAKAQAGS